MTFFGVLLGVFAFILAPIIALKPRGKQSRLEKLRLLAREKGARYSLRRLPPLKTELSAPEPLVVYTIQPATQLINEPEWILRRTHYTHDVNFFKDWDWANQHRPTELAQKWLINNLDNLPESIIALSAGGAGIAFFWKEETDEQTLLAMLNVLQQIHDLYTQD
jgi:hypothetical protein